MESSEQDEKQDKKQRGFDWLKAYQWQKGQSGNPGGRPKKTMKVFAREFLESMNEADRIAYFSHLDPMDVWKMAEGNPKQDTDITTDGKPIIMIAPQIANKNGLDTTNTSASNDSN